MAAARLRFGERRFASLAARAWALMVMLAALSHAPAAETQPAWSTFGGDAQHAAVSRFASQPLWQIVWQTPVDLIPHYGGTGDLNIHYGSPLASSSSTVVVPVKVGALDTFRVEARSGGSGALLWQLGSDYTLPAHGWIPSFGPALTPSGGLYMPGAGGTLWVVDHVDTAGTPVPRRLCFYGLASYDSDPVAFGGSIQICTPLTCSALGAVYFGYRATGTNPLNIMSGFARIAEDGSAVSVSASAATAGQATQVLMNCAPALSNDGATVYVVMTRNVGDSRGNLVALDATTLATQHQVPLKDPKTAKNANLYDDGTASPMVGPDGRIYIGVVENPYASNRGWMLQFTPALASAGPPGSFGWDDTPSVIPAGMVPSYLGASPYLLMTKYNNYADAGGDGISKLAILDPRATQVDPRTGATVMKEVLTIAGVTPDSEYIGTHPNAVREWCINTAAVDSTFHSVLANSEDGKLYRWSLDTNTFSEVITLTPGIGEAYTPTVIGRDGKVYAINHSILFAIGASPSAGVPDLPAHRLELAAAIPTPFRETTTLHFALRIRDRVVLEILDVSGRRVATLVDAELPAGDHVARWEGRDASGRRCGAGIYFARLTSGSQRVIRKLVLCR